ncbi:MAG: MFS transporter, partial [Actinobacteria bacterium]|nr:MFS transporter [Actinomycetota bacterium]
MSADPTIAAGAGATAADAAAVNAAAVEAAVASAEAAPGAPDGAPPQSGYAVKPLYLTAPFAMLVLFVVWTAIPSFLIPVQVQTITGQTDTSSLAFASVFGSVAAMIGNPIFGQLSDRTRSRFGRRTPWIAVCGIIGALVVFLQGSASSIVMLGVCWAATNLILNGFQAAFVATVPDRVPRNRLGVVSSLIGAGLNAGVLVGSLMFVFFPQLASSAGYTVLAVLIVVATLLFVLVSPDRDARELPREPFRLGEFLRGCWVSPRKHPDFGWVFL